MEPTGSCLPPQPPRRLARRAFLLGGGVAAASAVVVTGLSLDGTAAPTHASRVSGDTGSEEGPLGLRVHTTQEWEARGPKRRLTVLRDSPRYIVVHHTFTANTTDRSVDHGFWLARAIQRAHMGRGWPDTGQHFTISRGGHVMEGRTGSLAATMAGHMVVGTQVRGANKYTVGIECEGTYNSVLPPASLLDSLVRMCAWLCTRYDLDPRTAIVPHMRFNATDCCGYRFAPTLPKLRAQVAHAMTA